MLAAGAPSSGDSVELDIPSTDSPDELLSFASSVIARVGRDNELAELEAFLGADQPFAWWVWTGPAGAGKSRLAVELCRIVSGTWHAGLLRESDQSKLADLQPLRPTLVVVDYAAQRGAWLADAIFRLSRRTHRVPVRLLVIERAASGPWWDTVQRLNRFEESRIVDATAYALPRELDGLSASEIRSLVKEVAQQKRATLSSTNVEDIADYAAAIDPAGRPLFAVIATLDWLDGNGASAGRDIALRQLLNRMDAQIAQRLAGSIPPGQARNLRTLATTVGGISADAYEHLLQCLQPPPGLLPGLYDNFQAVPFDELADGVRPDILGELHVLDRLAGNGAEHYAAKTLIRLGWRTARNAYHAFVERTAADHREHERLADLLDVGDWHESPVPCAQLVTDVIPLLRRSDHPALEWIFTRLADLQAVCKGRDVDEIVATARYRFANLVFFERDIRRANALYTEMLDDCDPAWSIYAGILNNRGITLDDLDREDAAIADYTAVIDAEAVADEARASSLNNRADIHDRRGDPAAAIADRTAVLNLSDTTYNRRYIAYSRRARTLWRIGRHDAALHDIDAILSTADIVMEQKMAARLQRAEWHVSMGAPAAAIPDLEIVSASVRNFEDTEARARELLADLEGAAPS
jgi:tetratricopeptide (TPR) repeat protein